MEDLSWILEDMNEDDLLDLEDKLKEKEKKDEQINRDSRNHDQK